MTGQAISTRKMTIMLAVIALAVAGGMATAEAGTLRAGAWTPSSCGEEPTAPAINASGAAAYNESVKSAEAFQKSAQQYEDCYFKEADADNHVISSALTDQQHHMQAVFDKLQADSKAAAVKLNKKQ
jgi:hypothetical protein